MRYHPLVLDDLTPSRYPAGGPWQPVSFTGAVSSQRVTEDCEGSLKPVGNRLSRIWLKASFTVRPTSQAVAKAGPSDPVVECGIAIA